MRKTLDAFQNLSLPKNDRSRALRFQAMEHRPELFEFCPGHIEFFIYHYTSHFLAVVAAHHFDLVRMQREALILYNLSGLPQDAIDIPGIVGCLGKSKVIGIPRIGPTQGFGHTRKTPIEPPTQDIGNGGAAGRTLRQATFSFVDVISLAIQFYSIGLGFGANERHAMHASWLHLGLNMVWLVAFGSPLANRIGALRFVLFWAVCVIGSLALHFVAKPDDLVPVVGASGAISGMMGAAARFGFRIDRSSGEAGFAGPRMTLMQTLMHKQAVIFLGVWLLINLAAGAGLDLSGSDGSIAWEAHIGGMLTGLLLIGLFDPGPKETPQTV